MIQSEIFQENLLPALIALGLLLLASGLLVWSFAKRGFFTLPSSPSLLLTIRGSDVLKGFGYFLFAELGLFSIFITMVHKLVHGMRLNPTWISLASVYAGAAAVALVYYELKAEQKQALWNRRGIPWYRSIAAGLINLAILYVPVILLGSMISLLVSYYFDQEPKNQLAVEFLRQARENPLQLFLTIIAVTVLAPFKEEFLFRGLLQSWLKQKINNTWLAIGITSLIFAFFHYAGSQEFSNISLLCALFVLSCGLGFIFEKEGSLWASIAMHAGFNTSQILLFFMS
jgi:uncharacterized protein